MKAPFRAIPEGPAAEEAKFWENPALMDTLKLVLGVALVMALAFGLVRPMLRNLVASHAGGGQQMAAGGVLMGADYAGGVALPAPGFDEKVAAAKNITGSDPARVAQIVSKWVKTDE